MFDRFIRLARAKRSLREGRFLDALQQARDPLIEADRRAEEIRSQAVEQLARRVEARLQGGDARLALDEARRLAKLATSARTKSLLAACERAVAARDQVAADQRAAAVEFRKLLDAGELGRAESLLVAAGDDVSDMEGCREHLAQRRKQAAAVLARATDQAEAGDGSAALDSYLHALAINDAPVEAARSAAMRCLAAAIAAELASGQDDLRHDPDGLHAALAGFTSAVQRLPALQQQRPMQELEAELIAAVCSALRDTSDLDAAARLGRLALAAGMGFVAADRRALETLIATDGGEAEGLGALGAFEQAAAEAGWGALAARAREEIARRAEGENELDAARALLESGQLSAARVRFVAFLKDHPMHAAAREELDMLDESMADLDRRLADVRMSLRAGRLRATCKEAMSLVGVERIAVEAQQILAEARERIQLVDRGVGQVKVALHSRSTASIEGVRHCLGKLQELAKMQVDHVELPALIVSVEAEIEALQRCAELADQIARGDLEALAKALPVLVDRREQLLNVERIDAKLCELGDELVGAGAKALEAGRLVAVERCCALLLVLGVVRGDFAATAASWRDEQRSREQQVADLIRGARAALAARDLDGAARSVTTAQRLWRESAEVQAFAHQLAKLMRQASMLDEAEALAEDDDLVGARDKLDRLSSVAPMHRTRVFDMKRDLARAQGLEGAFLLRVDEGGEQLVMRGETVMIGNVRKSSADLPVLANIAGRHASVQRSMSFHGGLEDAIVAADGDVYVDDREVSRRALQAGDVVRLGSALSLVYRRPSPRSLSSKLVLQGGFQVAGTDRVLLMKDRGRDGRILIGPGRDAHVCVPTATGEVELYANNDGQMRVFCDSGGSIDGTVFTGEHPVAAGQLVEAGGVTFLLLPWSPA